MRKLSKKFKRVQRRGLKLHGLEKNRQIIWGRRCVVLQSITWGFIGNTEYDAAYKSIKKCLRKVGIIERLCMPYFRLTRKPVGARMGKAKGKKIPKINAIVYPVHPGKIIFGLRDVSFFNGDMALRRAAERLSLNCKIRCL